MSQRGDKHGGDRIDVYRGLHAAVMLSGVFNLDSPIRIIPVRNGKVHARECAQVQWDLLMIACSAIKGRTPGPEFFEQRYHAHA